MRRTLTKLVIVAALAALPVSVALSQVSGGTSGSGSGIFGVTYPKPTKAGLALNTKFGTATGTYTVADTVLGVNFTDTANEGTNLQGSLMAYPGSAFTYTVIFKVMPTCDISISIGPAAAATGASQVLTQHCSGSFANGSIDVEDWTDTAGTFGSINGEISTTGTPFIWLRYKDDGTNSVYFASGDGVNWRKIFSDPKSSGWLSLHGGYHFFGVILAYFRNNADATNPAGAIMVGQQMTTP